MVIILVTHDHNDYGEGGSSTYLFQTDSEDWLTEASVVEALNIDFEPDQGEVIDWTAYHKLEHINPA